MTGRGPFISHSGPAFCAGHDMKEMTAHRSDSDHGRGYFRSLMERCSALMQSIQKLPQPVIAAVEGVAAAAGCQLVATCDLAVASETARFSTPGVHIGLFCSTPMVALSRNVSNKHAMEMLLTGDMVSAADAHRMGLVNRVVPAGKASEHALELARQIASKSMLTVKLGKQAFYRQGSFNLAAPSLSRRSTSWSKHDGARRRGKASARSSKNAIRFGEDASKWAPMNNSNLVFTPAVQKAQEQRGSAKAYAQRVAEGFPDKVTPELASFIAEQDTAFLATANAQGAPYIQHRGGPKGFIKVLDERTLGFADYKGNRQYITLANLSENDHAYLFLLDPARRQRIKLWGCARVVENDPVWWNGCSTKATRPNPNAPFTTIEAWDVNCLHTS